MFKTTNEEYKPTFHLNNNRNAPGKLKYEFLCLCGMRIQNITDLTNHEQCDMISLNYQEVFKAIETIIGDGSDVNSVQNLYGIMQMI